MVNPALWHNDEFLSQVHMGKGGMHCTPDPPGAVIPPESLQEVGVS